jgi:hypothetical protein
MRRREFITLSAARQSQYATRDPGKGWFPHFRFYAPKEVNFVERGAIWISENS